MIVDLLLGSRRFGRNGPPDGDAFSFANCDGTTITFHSDGTVISDGTTTIREATEYLAKQDPLAAVAIDRYERWCQRNGYMYQKPSEVLTTPLYVEGCEVHLRNGDGLLAAYRYRDGKLRMITNSYRRAKRRYLAATT
jgi:hypothetical protein